MHVVYVVKRFPKVSETFVQNEVLEVLRQGDEVTVCSLRRPHPGEPPSPRASVLAARTIYVPEGPRRVLALVGSAGVVLLRRRRRAWGALWWALRFTWRTREFDQVERFAEAAWLSRRGVSSDVGHIHAHFAHGPATVALLLARLTGIPFTFTGHAKDIFQLVPASFLAAKAKEARAVVTVSAYTQAHVRDAVEPEDRHKVVVVRNGLEPGRFERRQVEPVGSPTIASVSRLVHKKGVDVLIDACALLADRGTEFSCRVIGEGPRRDRLAERADRAGVADRIELLGSLDRDGVARELAGALVFALPCRRTKKGDQDGLPVALVEAMAVGVPVVTTPVSGIPELVLDERSGLLVHPEDPAALADALDRLLSDPALRRRLVASGAEALSDYDLAENVARLRALFGANAVVPAAPA